MLSALYSIITEKQEDDEIVLQILYAFFHLLQSPEPRYSLLFKIVVDNFLHCGADISFLSCFPGECEYLFPPNTYLLPTQHGEAAAGPRELRQPPQILARPRALGTAHPAARAACEDGRARTRPLLAEVTLLVTAPVLRLLLQRLPAAADAFAAPVLKL